MRNQNENCSSEELWRRALLPVNATIQQAISNLDEVAIKIVLVVNDNGELEGTISDGDIRRGLLKGLSLYSPIEHVVHSSPLVVPPEMERSTVTKLMITNKIQQIPIISENGLVVGLHLWDEISTPVARQNLMVIMAGGRGARLSPHTENCPKPMLPVSGKPMLEHIIERAKMEGFSHFVLAIHYLGHLIEEYFGDGERLGVRIDYLREQSPLGTAGALSLLESMPDMPLVVTNGDVLTDIRYGELLDFHIRQNAAATMAVRVHEWEHPFGVVQTQGVEIVGFLEKPLTRTQINAGVYVLSPDTLNELTAESPCEMPEVFGRLQAKGKRTVAYPMHEFWIDVGKPADINTASETVVNNLSEALNK